MILDVVIDLVIVSSIVARSLQILSATLLVVLLDECILSIERSVSGEGVLFRCFWRVNRRDRERDNVIPWNLINI